MPGASSSSALFVSGDGTVVIGRAVVGAQELVVRWVGGAAPATFTPPNGLLIETINAIDPEATAAVGALRQQSAGGSPLGLFASTAISGDGERILATGTASPSPQDTSAVILAFQGLP